MGSRKDLSADIRFRAVKLIKSGRRAEEIAYDFGVSRATVYKWASKYESKRSISNFENKPKSGRPKVAVKCDWNRVYSILEKPASKFGFDNDLWNITKTKIVIKKEFKCDISRNTIWRRLKAKGFRFKSVQKQFREMQQKNVDDWTKNTLPEILKEVEKSRGILFFGDESKISLSPMLGKTWVRKGKDAKVNVTSKRGGVSVISAISKSGHLQFSIWKRNISSKEVIEFCKRLVDSYPRRKIFLILDNARTHKSKKFNEFLESSPRLKVFFFTSL